MVIKKPYEFWESDLTINYIKYPSKKEEILLQNYFVNNMDSVIESPFIDKESIEKIKLKRLKELIDYAYRHTKFYRDKYNNAGLNPKDINSLSDFEKVPLVSKEELIKAFPHHCVDLINYSENQLFKTHSSGSSGKIIKIYYDKKAIYKDTLHGVRQWCLQSANKYKSTDKVAMIYTCPWWFRKIGNEHEVYFISSLINKKDIASILYKLRPGIISCYPSVLEGLLPYLNRLDSVYLIVIHSEQSSKNQRMNWSNQLGVDVLDEYSSEEATRIALELPCSNYHICEDAVHLESLDTQTLKPSGEDKGRAVVTNLLNTAMPIIRYIQGDIISLSNNTCSCGNTWRIMNSIHGRENDSFVSLYNKKIDSGTLLDITYRWIIETSIDINRFSLTQITHQEIQLSLTKKDYKKIKGSQINTLAYWLKSIMHHPIELKCSPSLSDTDEHEKRRVIKSIVNL